MKENVEEFFLIDMTARGLDVSERNSLDATPNCCHDFQDLLLKTVCHLDKQIQPQMNICEI